MGYFSGYFFFVPQYGGIPIVLSIAGSSGSPEMTSHDEVCHGNDDEREKVLYNGQSREVVLTERVWQTHMSTHGNLFSSGDHFVLHSVHTKKKHMQHYPPLLSNHPYKYKLSQLMYCKVCSQILCSSTIKSVYRQWTRVE